MVNKTIEALKIISKNPKRIKHYYIKVAGLIMSTLKRNEVITLQDNKIKTYSSDTKKLILFLVPGWDGVNGGVMSICSIADVSRNLVNVHGSEVLIATVPKHTLFPKYSGFENSFSIFRFEQIFKYFKNVQELILHIPENFVVDFQNKISREDADYLKKIKHLQINILNQNIWLMPEPKYIDELRSYSPNITITVAHKKYCTKKLRDKYNAPVHLLSTSNLTKYYYKPYEKKEDLLLTSIDDHPLKEEIIRKLKKELPSMGIKQIENMSYDSYKNWISRAKWMITFGEGIDGYFVESIRSGAIPFTAYNADFFSDTFEGIPNVYENYKEMLNRITDDIKNFDNPESFKKLNDHLIHLDQIEYNDEGYKENIYAFYKGDYTLPHPGKEKLSELREERLKKKPLVSIVMAVYNGELYLQEQLNSIANLSYNNIELIISDDGSQDSTVEIIKGFQEKYPLTLVHNEGNKGVNGNFENGLKYSKGDFIALCDQDDIWLPNKIETLLKHIDDYDIIHSTVELVDNSGEPHKNKLLVQEYTEDHSDKTDFFDFLSTGWMLGCTSLIRRELVEKAMPFPEGVFFHDWWLTLISIKEGNGIKFINTPTIKYRQHSNNTAQKTFASFNWFEKKIKFNRLIETRFKDQLSTIEKVAIRNNTNYCAVKYFLLVDHKGDYDKVDTFITENKDLVNRYFFNKFVEIVAEDISLAYGANNDGKSLSFMGILISLLKRKIKEPNSLFDKVLSKVYFLFLKPLIITPYRMIKQ